MIETIEADATRLTRLITELLDISRLDSDSLNLRLGPVDLHALLTTHVVRYELGRSTGTVELRWGSGSRTGCRRCGPTPTGSSRSSSTSSRTGCCTAPGRSR